MKFILTATVIAAYSFGASGLANASETSSASALDGPSRLAGLFDKIVPSSSSDTNRNNTGPISAPPSGDRNATGTQSFNGFSGQYTDFIDSFNGFKIKLPSEFSLQNKGATTIWGGPLLVGRNTNGEEFTGGGLISVNTVEWPAGNPSVACNATVTQYQSDRFYPNDKISSKQVRFGEIPATVVFFEESIYQRGTRDEKNPDDHHRMHFQVCGNGRIYNGILGYYYGFFKRTDINISTVFEAVRQSFQLVPADNAAIGG